MSPADAAPGRRALLSADAAAGWRALLPADAGYPALLLQTRAAPPLLVQGDLPARAPMVAVVGARRCTPYGEELAFRFGATLAAAGLTVVSGLARGVDAAAHRGALAAGGRTVAVMGTGPDTIYPPVHRHLAGRIAAGGALVTQFPPGMPPRPENFPIRNAVISGLSLGVVVVEARGRSGAVITAGTAAEQGRTVMAVPGSVHSPCSRGCHDLIRDGAVLVTAPEEVLEVLGMDPLRACLQPPERAGRAVRGEPALELLEGRPSSLEELRAALHLAPAEAAALVTRLRADGLVGLSGGLYRALHPISTAPFGGAPKPPG